MACYQHNALMAALRRPRLLLSTNFTQRSIVSYGFMLYARDTGRWLLVQRRHSVEFILVLRGNYCYSHLPIIARYLTREEIADLLSLLSAGATEYARFIAHMGIEPEAAKHGYSQLQNYSDALATLLRNVKPRDSPLWTWPKGRCDWNETPFEGAMREFEEEVGVSFPFCSYISTSCYSHSFRSLQGTEIVTRCWVCAVSAEFPLPLPKNHPEVNASRWVATADLPRFLGPEAFMPPE